MSFESTAEDRGRREAIEAEIDRKTIADLLLARKQYKAAALLALSTYRKDCVDNWDGGQWEVTLALPAELYDSADAEQHHAIDSAASVIIGPNHYSGLTFGVRPSIATEGWDVDLIAFLRDCFENIPMKELDSKA